jgi:hypothetical protein
VKIRRVSWLLLCCALVILGCEGKEGPAGPTGPAGPAGSANVIYSEWFSPATWDLQTTFGVHERSYTMTVPALTADIIGHGMVLVYMKFAGIDPAINQLPLIIVDFGTSYDFQFRAAPGTIEVVYFYLSAPTTDPSVIPPENQVRYVLIPGGVLAASAQREGIPRAQLAGSMISLSYSEVCRLFDIPE